ncbi:MAG: hypothetical protein VX339_11180 [Pseudomonadota bacterium]|nr:hypothetical protein [Pseudomonadota bacterium]
MHLLLSTRSGLAYAALGAGILSFLPGVGELGAVLVFAAILLGWRDLRWVSRMLLVLVVLTLALAAVFTPSALPAAAASMTRLTALILTVMLLSAMLGRSADLGAISRQVFAGSPMMRYYGVAFGTGFLSMPLNFGSVGVMATMIRGEMDDRGDTATTRNASRGVLRGFGASPIFSPLSISIVLTITFVPALKSWELIAVSLPLAVLYLLVGGVFREPEQPDLPVPEPAEPVSRLQRLAPWLRFAGIIGAICVATFSLSGALDLSYSRAVTLSCFGAVLVGVGVRKARGAPAQLPSMAPMSNELVIVGGSAFLGTLISVFAAQWLGVGFSLPGWAYPVAAFTVPWVFFLGGMLGFNPIVTGTLTGGVLGPIWPVGAVLGLGMAMVAGWGLTTAGTPYSANSLLLERLTGYSARDAALSWNLWMSVCCLLVSGLLAGSLTLVLS